jgi:hypothetical protein
MRGFRPCSLRLLVRSTSPFLRGWATAANPPGCCYHYRNPRLFPIEMSIIVGDDGVRDPESENDVPDEIHYLPGANLIQGPCLDPLSELVNSDEQVGQAPRHFLEGLQKVQAPHDKQPCNGDGLKLLGRCMDLPHEVLASPAGHDNLRCVAGGRWLVKTLSKSLSDHASR